MVERERERGGMEERRRNITNFSREVFGEETFEQRLKRQESESLERSFVDIIWKCKAVRVDVFLKRKWPSGAGLGGVK